MLALKCWLRFNFATVFTENAFVGNDRISDANLLTLGWKI